jgi:hypothetical protein
MHGEMPTTNAVPGFLPSTHGLRFPNRWLPGPTVTIAFVDPRIVGVGDASNGLCGGMSWFVREWFEAGRAIPRSTVAPDAGTPLFRAIVRRQVQSLDWLRGPVRFWWMGLHSLDWARQRSLEVEWPRIRATIDDGRLALTGLVRHRGWHPMLTNQSHTVLVFGYTIDHDVVPAGDRITLRLYDPNHPGRDDVTVILTPGSVGQATGERLNGILALG